VIGRKSFVRTSDVFNELKKWFMASKF
jgi:hypothetical protein